MTLVGGERCQSVFSNQTFNNYSSLCAENRHSATCEVRKPIKRVDNAKTARRAIAEDRLPSWTLVIITLWLDWSVKGSRRIIATRWKRLILPILYFAYSVSIFCAPFFSWSCPFLARTWHLYKHCQPYRMDRGSGERKYSDRHCCFFLKSKVKENGGMASCSALLGSPPALGKIDHWAVYGGHLHLFTSIYKVIPL